MDFEQFKSAVELERTLGFSPDVHRTIMEKEKDSLSLHKDQVVSSYGSIINIFSKMQKSAIHEIQERRVELLQNLDRNRKTHLQFTDWDQSISLFRNLKSVRLNSIDCPFDPVLYLESVWNYMREDFTSFRRRTTHQDPTLAITRCLSVFSILYRSKCQIQLLHLDMMPLEVFGDEDDLVLKLIGDLNADVPIKMNSNVFANMVSVVKHVRSLHICFVSVLKMSYKENTLVEAAGKWLTSIPHLEWLDLTWGLRDCVMKQEFEFVEPLQHLLFTHKFSNLRILHLRRFKSYFPPFETF